MSEGISKAVSSLPSIRDLAEADLNPNTWIMRSYRSDEHDSNESGETVAVMRRNLHQLARLLGTVEWSSRELLEILALFNDAAYVSFTLEKFDDHEIRATLRSLCDRFFTDADVRITLHERLALINVKGELDDARRELDDQLGGQPAQIHDMNAAGEVRLARSLGRLDLAQRSLLTRLGIDASKVSNTSIAFNHLLSHTESEATRTKLARVWQMQTDMVTEDLINGIDELAASLRRRGITRLSLYETNRADKLRAHLLESLNTAALLYRQIDSEVRSFFDDSHAPLSANFPRFIHLQFGDIAPTFDANEIIDYAFHLAREIDDSFDLTPQREGLYSGERGIIVLDVWRTEESNQTSARSENLRNRMSWGPWRQLPVAHVQCNFRPTSSKRLSLRSATTLLHEIGHAVNHILSRGNLSYTSGLYYLPPERRECMSIWFEKRILDDAILLPSLDNDCNAARNIREVWQLTERKNQFESTLAAMLDFTINVDGEESFLRACDRITENLSCTESYSAVRLATHLASPRFVAHPGNAVAYTVGEAFSREVGAPGEPQFTRESFEPLISHTSSFDIFSDSDR